MAAKTNNHDRTGESIRTGLTHPIAKEKGTFSEWRFLVKKGVDSSVDQCVAVRKTRKRNAIN
jgi:hypothetical protein